MSLKKILKKFIRMACYLQISNLWNESSCKARVNWYFVNYSSVFRFVCSFAYMTDSASPGWPQVHYEAEDDIDLAVFLSPRIMALCGAEDPAPGFIHGM